MDPFYVHTVKLPNNHKTLLTISKEQTMANRKNPLYPPWKAFTVVKCKECGEYYEPICEFEHICKKQNSYPVEEMEDEDECN